MSSMTYKASARYGFGWTNPSGVFGRSEERNITFEDVGELALWLLSYGFKALPLRTDELLAMNHPYKDELAIVIGEYPKGTVCLQRLGRQYVNLWLRYKAGEVVDPTK